MRLATLARFALPVLLAACGGGAELAPRPAAVPSGIDLSGDWVLRETSGTVPHSARTSLVYAFLESGQALKITQTPAGLFVSFDRSVVEEYRFGENREVSVGEVTAQRVSGWDGAAYVIETLDREGDRLVDTYRLESGGGSLSRSIAIWSGERRKLALEYVYDRS